MISALLALTPIQTAEAQAHLAACTCMQMICILQCMYAHTNDMYITIPIQTAEAQAHLAAAPPESLEGRLYQWTELHGWHNLQVCVCGFFVERTKQSVTKPSTLKPSTLNPKLSTLNPQP